MAKRPRYSRWRRLPQVHRSGEFKLPLNSEPQRLTVYIAEHLLDAAEVQAKRAGVETIQQYCAEVLSRALDAERVREQVAEMEARSGPLEGLDEIANDPEYLAEWSALAGGQERPTPSPPSREARPQRVLGDPIEGRPPIVITPPSAFENARGESSATPPDSTASEALGASARVILFHAGQLGDDASAFLPSLRRGMSVAVGDVAELARALQVLENEARGAQTIDRRVAFALHRLAYEGQVLHTDAWPGVYDEWTVDALRAVQEAVERILSGQDIRYYPPDSRPEDPR